MTAPKDAQGDYMCPDCNDRYMCLHNEYLGRCLIHDREVKQVRPDCSDNGAPFQERGRTPERVYHTPYSTQDGSTSRGSSASSARSMIDERLECAHQDRVRSASIGRSVSPSPFQECSPFYDEHARHDDSTPQDSFYAVMRRRGIFSMLPHISALGKRANRLEDAYMKDERPSKDRLVDGSDACQTSSFPWRQERESRGSALDHCTGLSSYSSHEIQSPHAIDSLSGSQLPSHLDRPLAHTSTWNDTAVSEPQSRLLETIPSTTHLDLSMQASLSQLLSPTALPPLEAAWSTPNFVCRICQRTFRRRTTLENHLEHHQKTAKGRRCIVARDEVLDSSAVGCDKDLVF